jgi:membrane-associated protease RseP (regulator of RpoE activity)
VLSVLVLLANLFANVSAMLGMLGRTGLVDSSTAVAATPTTTASSSTTSTKAMETEAAGGASPSIMAAGQLTPLLPGINLPIEHAWYLLAAAAVSLIVHEAGHALAARADGIKVTGFGCFLALVMPGAYVNLDEDIIDFVPARKRLRIFAAGPYHNGLLSLFCEATRRILPLLLLPAYTRLGERGVAVTSVVKDSPLSVTVSLPLPLSLSPLFSSLLSLPHSPPLSPFSSCSTSNHHVSRRA